MKSWVKRHERSASIWPYALYSQLTHIVNSTLVCIYVHEFVTMRYTIHIIHKDTEEHVLTHNVSHVMPKICER